MESDKDNEKQLQSLHLTPGLVYATTYVGKTIVTQGCEKTPLSNVRFVGISAHVDHALLPT